MIAAVMAMLSVASAATPADGARRTLSEGIDVAVDYCAATAFSTEARLDGRLVFFTYAPGAAMAESLRARGERTTADAPALIQRFAATAMSSRIFGHRDIVAIEAGDGVVWLVTNQTKAMCDIGITDIDDIATIAPAITAAVESNAGWANAGGRTAGTSTLVTFAFTAKDAKAAKARIAGTVIGGAASSSGIQAEINFVATDAAAPTSPNN